MPVSHPLVKKDKVTLREYQEAAVARAIDENTLVVLPTGLGKTLIAVMVAAHRLMEFPGSKILLLAPTRPLVEQHRKSFEDFLTPHKMCVLTGMVSIEKRRKLWSESSIVFATPQTIGNDLMRDLDLNEVSLIVFDEAHRAVGDYAYVYIAKKYVEAAKNPLVLGLTASPSSSEEKINEIMENLSIRCVEAKTEHDRDVKPYVSQVEVKWIKVELPQEFRKVKSLIEDVLRERLKKLKGFEYLTSAQLVKVNKRVLLGIQAEIRKEITRGMDSFVPASIVAEAIKVNHALELLETQGMTALDKYLARLLNQRSKAVRNLSADPRMKDVVKIVHDLVVLGVEHPKLDELAALVAGYKERKVLVFTQYRDTVDKIIERLNQEDILVHEFIGQAPRDAKSGMSQKKQVEVLEKFRNGAYTALVATSVAEEGLDIPAVDLVVFYEPIPSEIRSIQRRGRTGRGEAGEVVVLMAKGTRDEGYYWSSIHKERKMGALVRSMRDGKKQKEILEYDTKAVDELPNKKEQVYTGQKSMLDYGVEFEGEGVTIFVDARERSQTILEWLKEKANVRFQNIPVGDYLVSDRVVVERKTIKDFLQSLVDKRLLAQMREMTRNFPNVVLVLEGHEDLFAERNIHPNAIRGVLASLVVDFGVAIVPTRDEVDSAAFIYALAKREQEDEGRIVSLRGERKPYSLSERQIFMVESLPNVSAVLARRLLARFGSVQALVNASESELMSVEGIGDAKASEIRKVLKSKFEKVL
ncbi:MAG: DEAD/DEAH box helicase [Candidatus Altiarchaeota archaeon]